MKYILTIIGVICLLACSSEETTRTASQMRPITFGDAYTVKPTRSSTAFTADKGIPLGQSMGVYAYLHGAGENFTTKNPNFMFNQQATSNEYTEQFVYSPVKYWPNDENSKVSFIAYFPYSNGAADDGTRFDRQSTGIVPTLDNSRAGLPVFNFTVMNNVEDQVDFLVSDVIANLPKTRDTEGDPGQPFNDLSISDCVTFLFKHMTAKVEFRIVADPDIHKDIVSFHLSELTVSRLFKDGTLEPSYNPSTGVTTFNWNSEEPQNTKQTYNFKTYEPQLLMPQVLGDDVMLRVSYEITFKSDGTTYHYVDGVPVADQEYTYTKTDDVLLNTMKRTGTNEALTTWEPNHHYIYTIRLCANRIDFTGQVVAWGDSQDIEGIEIKDE